MNKFFNLLKYPIAYIRLLLLLGIIAIFLTPALIVNIFIDFNYHQKFLLRKACLSFILPALGLSVKLFGSKPIQQHNGQLIVSNHRSFTDPLIELRWLSVLPLSKAEVKKYPIVGQGADITGILYIERTNNRSRYNIRKAIGEALDKNINVFLYPEGTTKDGRYTSQFQSGSIKEAIATKSQIIPVVIEYKDPNDYWVGNSFHDQFIYQLGKLRSDIGLWIGEPMFYDDPKEFISELRKVMDQAIDEIHDYWKS